jgi:hypothetical protein
MQKNAVDRCDTVHIRTITACHKQYGPVRFLILLSAQLEQGGGRCIGVWISRRTDSMHASDAFLQMPTAVHKLSAGQS